MNSRKECPEAKQEESSNKVSGSVPTMQNNNEDEDKEIAGCKIRGGGR